MSTVADPLAEIQRLTDALAKERATNAGLRREILTLTSAKIRLHGHCATCEYVSLDLKPLTEPVTERFGNGG